MATKNSNLYPVNGAFVPAAKVSGRVRVAWSGRAFQTAEMTVGDTYTTARLPKDARPFDVSLAHQDIQGLGAAISIGVAGTPDLFATGITVGANRLSWFNFRFDNSGLDTLGQRFWELLGGNRLIDDQDMVVTFGGGDATADANVGFQWLYTID